jgi:plastocyanin
MKKRLILVSTGLAFGVVVLMGQSLQDLTDNPAEENAEINFGSLHPQPPAPASHVLLPDEVTIFKKGTVNFIVNGAAHGIAIYEVSKNTTRADIEEDLCQGGPAVCNMTAGTGALPYTITDGNGDIIMETGTNPPLNRINSLPGQLFSVGAGVLLTGSTPTTAGSEVRYRFEKSGRYLVICMNRAHYLNDWMFGFVNVQG